MGWLNRLFIAKKAVAKNQAKEAAEELKEKTDILKDKVEDVWDKTKTKASEVWDTAKDKYDSILDRQDSNEISESNTLEKAKDKASELGDKVPKTGETIVDKTAQFTENVGEKVLEVGGETIEKAKDLAEKISKKISTTGEKVKVKTDEILNNPKESLDKAGQSIQKAIDKIKDHVTTSPDDFADTPLTESKLKDSTLQDTDDFFGRADKFAQGNYSGEDEMEITKSEKNKKEKDVKIIGFEDRDGDGDELIDDAILIEKVQNEIDAISDVENVEENTPEEIKTLDTDKNDSEEENDDKTA